MRQLRLWHDVWTSAAADPLEQAAADWLAGRDGFTSTPASRAVEAALADSYERRTGRTLPPA